MAAAAGGLQEVQQDVLRSYATSGHAPAMTVLGQTAGRYGRTAAAMLADLHAEDLLQLDATGPIPCRVPVLRRADAAPDPDQQRPQVHAMCAIDALGIAAMLATAVISASSDPHTGQPVTVTVPARGQTAVWQLATTVVFAGCRNPGRRARR